MPFRLIRLMLVFTLFAGALFAASCGKKTPEDKLVEAQKLLQERQTPLAILKLRDLIREHPNEDAAIDARFGLASIYQQLGREENIAAAQELYVDLYRMLGVKDNRGFQALSQVIGMKLGEDDFDAAFTLMDEAIDGMADEPAIQESLKLQKAMVRLLTQDEDQIAEGVAYIEATMTGSGEHMLRSQAREVLAKYYRDEGKFEESSAVYDRYLEAFPEDPVRPMLIITQAINATMADNMEAAALLVEEGHRLMMEQIEEELNLNRRSEMLNNMAALLSTAQEYDKAEAAFRRIMAEQPATRTALDAQIAIATMHLQAGNLDRALETFEAINRENPNTPIAEMAQRGIGYIGSLRQQQAEESATTDTEETTE